MTDGFDVEPQLSRSTLASLAEIAEKRQFINFRQAGRVRLGRPVFSQKLRANVSVITLLENVLAEISKEGKKHATR